MATVRMIHPMDGSENAGKPFDVDSQYRSQAISAGWVPVGFKARPPIPIHAEGASLVQTPSKAQQMVNRLPDMGETVGSFMGFNPLTRTANAARMRVAGRAISHDINALTGQEQSWTPRQAWDELSGEAKRAALTQGTGEAVGGAVVHGVARPLMASAMGQPVVRRGVDLVMENLNKVRAPVGRILGKLGSAKATAAREASSAVLDRHMADMAQGGVRINGSDVIDRAYQKLSQQMAKDSGEQGANQLQSLYQETAQKHGKALDPRLANQLKQHWDRSAKPVYAALAMAEKGGPMPDPTSVVRAQWDKAIADEMRTEIENTSKAFTGGIDSPAEKINQVTSRKIGVEDAIQSAESQKRKVNPLVAGVGAAAAGVPTALAGHAAEGAPAALAGAIGAHYATSPQVTSRLALFASDPYFQGLLRQAPRFVYGAMQGSK